MFSTPDQQHHVVVEAFHPIAHGGEDTLGDVSRFY
jgi:hypothetical protein